MAEGVVLLHALARGRDSMKPLDDALAAAGYTVLRPAYPSRRAPVADLAGGLAPQVAAFAKGVDRLHFVGHSLGGLVARALIGRERPARLGRLVTLGTPHAGSEIADLLQRNRLFRAVYGPVSAELSRAASAALNARLGAVDYPFGAIAGTRPLNLLAAHLVLPRPNDGTVSVASATAGAADTALVACDHFFLPRHAEVAALCRAFLASGEFPRRGDAQP